MTGFSEEVEEKKDEEEKKRQLALVNLGSEDTQGHGETEQNLHNNNNMVDASTQTDAEAGNAQNVQQNSPNEASDKAPEAAVKKQPSQSEIDSITEEIESACYFNIVEPVFFVSGFINLLFGVAGLYWAMYAMDRAYGFKEIAASDEEEDDGNDISKDDKGQAIEMTEGGAPDETSNKKGKKSKKKGKQASFAGEVNREGTAAESFLRNNANREDDQGEIFDNNRANNRGGNYQTQVFPDESTEDDSLPVVNIPEEPKSNVPCGVDQEDLDHLENIAGSYGLKNRFQPKKKNKNCLFKTLKTDRSIEFVLHFVITEGAQDLIKKPIGLSMIDKMKGCTLSHVNGESVAELLRDYHSAVAEQNANPPNPRNSATSASHSATNTMYSRDNDSNDFSDDEEQTTGVTSSPARTRASSGSIGYLNEPQRPTLEVNDIITMRLKSVDLVKKIRQQVLGFEPVSPYYNLLGRSRKERLLFEIVLDENYMKRDGEKRSQNRSQNRNRGSDENLESAMSSGTNLSSYATSAGGETMGSVALGMNPDTDAPNSGFFDLDRHFFNKYQACIIGKDYLHSIILVEGFPSVLNAVKDPKFITVHAVPNSRPPRSNTAIDTMRGILILSGFVLSVGCASFVPYIAQNLHTIFLLLAFTGLLLRAVTPSVALASINGPVLILFGFSDAMAATIKTSGVDDTVTNLIIYCSQGNLFLTIFLLYFIVAGATNFLNNITCAQMLLPIVVRLCAEMQIPMKPMITLLINASIANFMTPIGCNQNYLTVAPGGYKFNDFVKGGWLLQILHLVSSVGGIFLWYMWFENY